MRLLSMAALLMVMCGCSTHKSAVIRQAKEQGIDTYFFETWCNSNWGKDCDTALTNIEKFVGKPLSSEPIVGLKPDDPMWFPAYLDYSPAPLRFPYAYPGHWECPTGFQQHDKTGYFGETNGGTGHGSGSGDKAHPPTCLVPGKRKELQ